MKNYKQKLSLLTISTLVLLGVSFVGAQTDTVIKDKNLNPIVGSGSSSFSGPCGAPGTCNAPEFLSASSTDQVKAGTIRAFGLRLKKFLFVGYEHGEDLKTRADGTMFPGQSMPLSLGVNGNVGASKYCDDRGVDCFEASQIKDLVLGVDEGFTCSATPAVSTIGSVTGGFLIGPYSAYAQTQANLSSTDQYTYVNGEFRFPRTNTNVGTMSKESYAYSSMNLPDSCSQDQGCVLKQVIYRQKDVSADSSLYADYIARVRYVDYHENTTGYWTSTDAPKGAINGDTKSSNIFKAYANSAAPQYQVILRDDKTGDTGTKLSVRPYDSWVRAGQEIYICTYPVDTAN